MHYKNLWLAAGVTYVCFILVASLTNIPEIELGKIIHRDKIIHFMLYFILVGWFVQLYKNKGTRALILVSAITLGMVIEYLQGMTSYRSFDWYDGVANSLGACCAFFLASTSFDSILNKADRRLYHFFND